MPVAKHAWQARTAIPQQLVSIPAILNSQGQLTSEGPAAAFDSVGDLLEQNITTGLQNILGEETFNGFAQYVLQQPNNKLMRWLLAG